MEKINILFLYSSKGFGGMVQNLSLIIDNLNRDFFNIYVVALVNAGDSDANIKITNWNTIHFLRIEQKKKWDIGWLKKIRDLILNEKIHILSCHGYKADYYGFLFVRILGCRVKRVSIAHGWVTPGIKLRCYYLLDKLVMHDYDKVILVESSMRRQLGPLFPERKIVVIENAIDVNQFTRLESSSEIRKEFHLDPNDLVIGFVGRLSPEKGIKTVLLAVREISKVHISIKLILAGAGPELESLRKYVDKLGIKDQVIFLGYQREIRKIYSILDIYVSASLKEGFPNNVLEAQSVGIPCVVSDIPGNRSIVQDGVNGYLFQVKNYKKLAQYLLDLSNDKVKVRSLIDESKKILAERFSLQHRIKKIEGVYLDLVNKNYRVLISL